MKAARVVVLAVAIGAGGLAALLAGHSDKPVEVKAPEVPQIQTVDILVANGDLPMGQVITPANLQWQTWPQSAASGNFIRKNETPAAIETLSGFVVRAPFVAGEPIREQKLVNAKGSGFMAAILPSGKRAVSTQISPETGAGGFILPNDRVDVILTRRSNDNRGTDQGSETVLSNIRVLAIDQTVEDKNGQKNVVGRTATLELSPSEAESLLQAQSSGVLTLALRSITDATTGNNTTSDDDKPAGRSTTVNIVRFGVSTPSTLGK